MVNWVSDSEGNAGFVGGFTRVISEGKGYAGPDPYVYRLASPGSVDLNGVTRQQYSTGVVPPFASGASFSFAQADVNALPAGKVFTATFFRAPASSFGPDVVPTPSQIVNAANQIIRGVGALGSTATRSTPGSLTLRFTPPNENMQVGAKYWCLIAPTMITPGSSPSAANDSPVGDINVNGRALSLWTNRTPEAPQMLSPDRSVLSGMETEVVFSPRDPDRIPFFSGDIGKTDFDDVAGFQVQYAPADTESWRDLPIANTSGTAYGQGWYLDEASSVPANSGGKAVWQSYRLRVVCGPSPVIVAGAARLTPGAWKVRVRTFDYGHPQPDGTDTNPAVEGAGHPPLMSTARSYTPTNYPAVNTSPWSAAMKITVSEQVLAPIPLYPANNVAIIDQSGSGASVTVSWRYRSASRPSLPQGARRVQMRKVGATSWTVIIDDSSSSNSFPVTSAKIPLVSGNSYEWRVQVRDTDGVLSPFSETAVFWVVPKPNSGEVVPAGGSTIDGATLGCGTHRVVVYRRGGKVRVGEIKNISSLEWNRVRDDISRAKITVSGWDIDCGELLKRLRTWAYEIVIFRNNGYSTDRVWEGPITLLTYKQDSVTIDARDVFGYAYRRIIRQEISDRAEGDTVVNRATRIIQNAFAPDDPNVLAYLTIINNDSDAMQYRSTPAFSRTAYEEVDDMAANAGLDYTTVGRRIIVWGTKNRIGTLPEFRDEDLGNSPIVSEYGMSMANRYAVSDGNGVYGEADRLNSEGKDPIYGLVEMLSSTWASDSEEDSGTYTQAGLETIRKSFAESSERSIADRYPPPLVVRIPDNTSLNPGTPISIQHLVPGVVIPLRSSNTLRSVEENQKLDAVKVVEAEGEEKITVTLSQFSREDNSAVEEAE